MSRYARHSENLLKNLRGYFARTFKKDDVIERASDAVLSYAEQSQLFEALRRMIKVIEYVLQKKEVKDSGGIATPGTVTTSTSFGATMHQLYKGNQKQSSCDLNSSVDCSNVLNASVLNESTNFGAASPDRHNQHRKNSSVTIDKHTENMVG